MYSTLFATALVFALTAFHVRAEFWVDTIVLTQCQPANLTWAQTQGPYDIAIVSSANPCSDPLVELDEKYDTTHFPWPKVNIAAGTIVTISILDHVDGEGWSGPITVQPSNDKSCLIPGTPKNAQSSPSTKPLSPMASPTPTIVGAANSGLLGNGASMIHLSGVAVAFTALGALIALL